MIKRSGVEEEVSEMDDLLNHVIGMSREFAFLPSVKGKSQANSHQEGIAIRENALINIFDDTSTIDVNEEIIESEGPKNNEEPGPSRILKVEDTPGKKRSILTPIRRRNVGLKQSTIEYLQKKMIAGMKSGVGNWHSKRGKQV
ncbi:unnamed protein product [Diabrotica balteata]|uniref:Uncharacterized protein n=1 Tax=Diabrotica balteata TaxID=107213 RepID=A0A9N9TAR1_DIABA|nr:unnamed protein product [Diabrotica balteata]